MSLSDFGTRRSIEIFCSYSHKDEGPKAEFEKAIAILRRRNWIQIWTDERIHPGAVWESEIAARLDSANIVILLVSSDFLNSEFCYLNEMSRALGRARLGQCWVLPIIVRACDWYDAPFRDLQVLPHNRKPVTSWENRDEAWENIAVGVKRLVLKLLEDQRVACEARERGTEGLDPFGDPVENEPEEQTQRIRELDSKIEEIKSDVRKSKYAALISWTAMPIAFVTLAPPGHAAEASSSPEFPGGNAEDPKDTPGGVVSEVDARMRTYVDSSAITSQEVVIQQYSGTKLPDRSYFEAAKMHGWYQEGRGTRMDDVGRLLELYRIPVTRYAAAGVEDLAEELARGHKVIIGIDSEILTARNPVLRDLGHLIDFGGADRVALVSGIDTSDAEHIKVNVYDLATGRVAAAYPVDQFLGAWHGQDFFMVATQEPPPAYLHIPEMANFDYQAGRCDIEGACSHAGFHGSLQMPAAAHGEIGHPEAHATDQHDCHGFNGVPEQHSTYEAAHAGHEHDQFHDHLDTYRTHDHSDFPADDHQSAWDGWHSSHGAGTHDIALDHAPDFGIEHLSTDHDG